MFGSRDAQQAGYTPIATEPRSDDPENDGEDTPLAVAPRAPPASGRDVYLCFWAIGAGVLLPWNALMCTFPLLMSLAPEGQTRNNLPSYLSTTFCFGNLFFLGLAQRNVSRVSPVKRLRWSLFLLLGCAVAMAYPCLPVLLPSLSHGSPLFMPVLLGLTLVLALACSFLQSGCVALAALWGSKEIMAVMSGQGGIAVLVSSAQLVLAILDSSRASSPEDDKGSTLAAFGLWALGAGWAIVCIVALRHLTEHPEFSAVTAPLALRDMADTAKSGRVTRVVARKNIRIEFAVAFVFVVTLALFPPITTTITSVAVPTPKWLQPAIFIAFHFLLFNIGDYTGRTYLPSIGLGSMTIPRIVLFSLSRLLFVPLFLLCNTPGRARDHKTVFPDFVYFIILLAFGLTNGWVSTLCMMFASSTELNPAITDEEKDIAGTLAAFSLVSGLAMGSLCSFAVNYAINGNPFGG